MLPARVTLSNLSKVLTINAAVAFEVTVGGTTILNHTTTLAESLVSDIVCRKVSISDVGSGVPTPHVMAVAGISIKRAMASLIAASTSALLVKVAKELTVKVTLPDTSSADERHGSMLHGFVCEGPTHGAPPLVASCLMLRNRCKVPPPHVLLH